MFSGLFYLNSLNQSISCWLTELMFNDMTTLVGHFVWSPREREKREEIVEEMKERDRGQRKMNESEETEEIKTFPIYLYLLQG